MSSAQGLAARDLALSKKLTHILRHRALDLGLHMQADGFVPLDEVLSTTEVAEWSPTEEDIYRIVMEDQKQRYQLQVGNRAMIRCVQGHSIKVVQDEQLLQPLDVGTVECCVHGTYRRHFESIKDAAFWPVAWRATACGTTSISVGSTLVSRDTLQDAPQRRSRQLH